MRFEYAAAEGERFGDAGVVVLYVTVPEDDSPVRVRVELRGKRATPYVESGALSLPLPAAKRYWINKCGGVIDPAADIAPGANHAFYALEHFAAAEVEGAVVAVVSHDCPLVSLGENGVYAYRREYAPHAPEMRFCLFNNMWGTNFPQWIEGDMAFEFDVFSETPGAIAEIYARACEAGGEPRWRTGGGAALCAQRRPARRVRAPRGRRGAPVPAKLWRRNALRRVLPVWAGDLRRSTCSGGSSAAHGPARCAPRSRPTSCARSMPIPRRNDRLNPLAPQSATGGPRRFSGAFGHKSLTV